MLTVISLRLPGRLYAEAAAIARMRNMPLNDYIAEALLDSVTNLQHAGWVTERSPTLDEENTERLLAA